MTESTVRQLAQSDPVPNLMANWATYATTAGNIVGRLTDCLRELDKLQDQLAAHDITVDIDLGQIGEAARAARRDLERERPGGTFKMPSYIKPGQDPTWTGGDRG